MNQLVIVNEIKFGELEMLLLPELDLYMTQLGLKALHFQQQYWETRKYKRV